MYFSNPVATLNASAVSLLMESRYEEANGPLEEALAMLRGLVANHLGGSQPNVVQQPPKNFVVAPAVASSSSLLDSICIPKSLYTAASSGEDGAVLFFNRAFWIHGDFLATTPNGEFMAALDVLCAATLYNMGLAHHLQAIQDGCTDLMEQALKMYQMATSILMKNDGGVATTGTSLAALTLALLNNMAHIHERMRHGAPTCACLELMRTVAQSAALEPWHIKDEDAEFFCHTLLLTPSWVVGSAPAA